MGARGGIHDVDLVAEPSDQPVVADIDGLHPAVGDGHVRPGDLKRPSPFAACSQGCSSLI
jgi:hypothetical protein